MKQISQAVLVGFVFLFVMTVKSYGIELLSENEALKEMLPEADKVVAETRQVSGEQIERVKKRLGGKLYHYQEGSTPPPDPKSLIYHVGSRNGVKTSVALIVEQPGKWGPVKYLIVVDPATTKIKDLTIMSYTEKRGRPIARRNFLKQFIDKSSRDPIAVNSDINGISGATISSDATCFAVKLTLALYEEVYLGK
jgi:Na+-translocating ferredoxin:NAD+ oxidoreductase RnfG subunit